MISGAAAITLGPPTCGAIALSTPTKSSAVTPSSNRVGDLPRVGGRWRVERDQRRQLDEGERAGVQSAPNAIELPEPQRLFEDVNVARGKPGQRPMRLCSNNDHLNFLSSEFYEGRACGRGLRL